MIIITIAKLSRCFFRSFAVSRLILSFFRFRFQILLLILLLCKESLFPSNYTSFSSEMRCCEVERKPFSYRINKISEAVIAHLKVPIKIGILKARRISGIIENSRHDGWKKARSVSTLAYDVAAHNLTRNVIWIRGNWNLFCIFYHRYYHARDWLEKASAA